MLEGQQALDLVEAYEGLWDRGEEVDLKQFSFTKSGKRNIDEPHRGGKLPELYDLPPDPEPALRGAGLFADYPHFLEVYRRFARAYVSCGKRDRKGPLYLETDKFLNFLYNEDEDKPSQEFKDKPHRSLSDSERKGIIQKYRKRHHRLGLNKGGDHSRPAELIQQYLAPTKVMQLTEGEIRMVARSLNSLGSNPLNLHKFLNKTNNDLDTIRRSWSDLIHGSGELIHDPGNLKLRMNRCHSALRQFGKAAIQEMLGYYYPGKYPLRNANTNAGLRFLGYNVK